MVGRDLIRPIKSRFFFILAAIFHWGAGAVFFEEAIEIGDVIKTGAEADLIDGFVGVQQQFTGIADADVNEKLCEIFVGIFFKKVAKCRFTHIHFGRHVADFDTLLHKIFQNVAVSHLNALALRLHRFGVKALAC